MHKSSYCYLFIKFYLITRCIDRSLFACLNKTSKQNVLLLLLWMLLKCIYLNIINILYYEKNRE